MAKSKAKTKKKPKSHKNQVWQKTPKKKYNKRNADKFAALKPHLNLKSRSELLDYDYLDKLSDKERLWLARFTDETIHAKFDHTGPKIYKTKKAKRQIYGTNNARNRDVLTMGRAAYTMGNIDDLDIKDDTEQQDRTLELHVELKKVLVKFNIEVEGLDNIDLVEKIKELLKTSKHPEIQAAVLKILKAT